MAVEIKELIIRAKIINYPDNSSESDGSLNYEDKESIIETCVQQVLQILERSQER